MVSLTERGLELVRAARSSYRDRSERLVAALSVPARASLEEQLPAWLAFFEPDERLAPRLGVAVAPSAVASRMRRAVGLSEEPGVLVLRVRPGSPAAQAELSRGDLVVEVGGEPVRSVGDLDRAVRAARGSLTVRVLRGAEPRELSVSFEAEGRGMSDLPATLPRAGAESPLDAYSRTVIEIAKGLAASVANLRVIRRTRRGDGVGGGSGVVSRRTGTC